MGIWKNETSPYATTYDSKKFSFYLDEESFTNNKSHFYLIVEPSITFNKFYCTAYNHNKISSNEKFENKFTADSIEKAKEIVEKMIYDAYDNRIAELEKEILYCREQQRKVKG